MSMANTNNFLKISRLTSSISSMNYITLLLEWNQSLLKHVTMNFSKLDNQSVELDLLLGVVFHTLSMSTHHVLPLKATTLLWHNKAPNSWWNLLKKFTKEKQYQATSLISINFKPLLEQSLQLRLLMTSLPLTKLKKLLKFSVLYALPKRSKQLIAPKALKNKSPTRKWHLTSSKWLNSTLKWWLS